MTTKNQQEAAVTPFTDDADAAKKAAGNINENIIGKTTEENHAAAQNPQHVSTGIAQQEPGQITRSDDNKVVEAVRSLCATATSTMAADNTQDTTQDTTHNTGDAIAREQQFKRDGYGPYGALFRALDTAGESTEAWSDFTALVADTVRQGRFGPAASLIRAAARDLTPAPTMASQLDTIMRDAEAADIAREAIHRAQGGSLQDARRMMVAARRMASAGYAVKLDEISRDIETWQSKKNTFRKNSKIMWAAILTPLALMTVTAIPSTIAFVKDPPMISLPDPQILARGVQPIQDGAIALGNDLRDSRTRIETMFAQKSAEQKKFDECVTAYTAFASAASDAAPITVKSNLPAIETILSDACQSFADRIEEVAAAAGRMSADQRASAVDEILQRVRGDADGANTLPVKTPSVNDAAIGDTAGDTAGAQAKTGR